MTKCQNVAEVAWRKWRMGNPLPLGRAQVYHKYYTLSSKCIMA